MSLRSDRWIRGDTEVALDSRVALRMGGATVDRLGGRPVIGIANSASDLNPCNQPLGELLSSLKEGVNKAGGLALAFPVMSLGEDLMKPTAMLYRNLVAMELEESIRSQPVDAVIILAACDKSVPGALMGAFSANVPTLLLVSGPRPVAVFEGRRIGTGTDLWRLWDQRRAGDVSDERWSELETALTLGKGTCNTMGTASSMGAIAEVLGLAWPGSTSIPAGDPRHHEIARQLGQRSVELVHQGLTASRQVSPDALHNALVVLSAMGGSTNAVIHLTALARRLGRDVSLEEVDRLSRSTPVLIDVEPSGAALMDDLDAAGGVPTLLKVLGNRLNPEVMMADGTTTGETQSLARGANGVVRELDNPVDAEGAFRVVTGNLAPDGALIKRCAATPSLLVHRGPAYVIGSYEELEERTGPNAQCPENAVLILRGVGPVGGPGMPEWGMIPIPQPLLVRGVTDMVRVTDARMSGTSFGTVYLHVAPEAAIGGPLDLVRDGDVIYVNADEGVIRLEIDDVELAARRSIPREFTNRRGYLELYRRHVMQAPDGCDFDFLVQPRGVSPQLVEPVVGRS